MNGNEQIALKKLQAVLGLDQNILALEWALVCAKIRIERLQAEKEAKRE